MELDPTAVLFTPVFAAREKAPSAVFSRPLLMFTSAPYPPPQLKFWLSNSMTPVPSGPSTRPFQFRPRVSEPSTLALPFTSSNEDGVCPPCRRPLQPRPPVWRCPDFGLYTEAPQVLQWSSGLPRMQAKMSCSNMSFVFLSFWALSSRPPSASQLGTSAKVTRFVCTGRMRNRLPGCCVCRQSIRQCAPIHERGRRRVDRRTGLRVARCDAAAIRIRG